MMNILIDALLLLVIYLQYRELQKQWWLLMGFRHKIWALRDDVAKLPSPRRAEGLSQKAVIKAAISAKLAERSFSLASSANLAVMAMQRTLSVRPRHLPKPQQVADAVAQKTVMEQVGGSPDYSGFDWMYPILNEEERDLLDKALEHSQKWESETKVKAT